MFDNGTLLVPAVGMGEEGEYTCYAENQGGQDTMKVRQIFSPAEEYSFTCINKVFHLYLKIKLKCFYITLLINYAFIFSFTIHIE